jgi:uroporphyrinogen-III synthase
MTGTRVSLPQRMDRLDGWTVVSLRPSSQQAAMRRAIAARGAVPLALPALRLAAMPDAAAATQALRIALGSSTLVFTSPAAVRFADRLSPLRGTRALRIGAVGRGTARALARHGLRAIHPGEHAMRSEGLLALPEFSAAAIAQAGGDVGLVTAPGGRGLILHALRARGARVRIAEVYRRLPPRFDRRHADALRASAAPRALLLTSAEALTYALERLPADALACLRAALVVASSERLARLAREHGFAAAIEAGAPTPQALLDALQAQVRGERRNDA